MNETNEMNYIIDLLEKKDAASYQAAIKYISHTMQELKDMKFAFDQASELSPYNCVNRFS